MTRATATGAPDLFAPGLFEGTGFYDAFASCRTHDPCRGSTPRATGALRIGDVECRPAGGS